MDLRGAVLLCFVATLFSSHKTVLAFTFAVVPKRTNNPFFEMVRLGCEARAARLPNVTCLYTGPPDRWPNATAVQIEIIQELKKNNTLDGLAIAVMNETAIAQLIKELDGIPVVTFDSDAPSSDRWAYVGTENKAFGRELAHVLLQLAPDGGSYGIISGNPSPNIVLREEGVREGLIRSGWTEVSSSPTNCKGKPLLALEQMEELVTAHPDLGAIIPVGGWPMFAPEGWEQFVEKYPNVTTVVADALAVQLELMNRGAADGLVGQLPFQMGAKAIDKLFALRQAQAQGLPPPFPKGTVFATSVLNVLQIPQDLPPLEQDMNYIGRLSIMGYVFCGIIVLTSLACIAWTVIFRKRRVVRASQPLFLVMICVGTILMGAALIPLGIDDQTTSLRGCSIACMSIPWLLCIGFATTFSALLTKTWRVIVVFRNAQRFRRVTVTVRDVMIPFCILMTLNVVVLLCWTLIAPLQYERRAHSGTDNWNRVYRSYYGACVGDTSDAKGGATPYVVLLVVINFSVLVVANVQAYRARKIKTEFSESRYIAFIMVTMLQSWIVGIPVVVLVREDPQATYVVMTVIIFATCMATLLFMFVPKIVRMQNRTNRTSTASSSSSPNNSCHNSSAPSTAVTEEPSSFSSTRGLFLRSLRPALGRSLRRAPNLQPRAESDEEQASAVNSVASGNLQKRTPRESLSDETIPTSSTNL